MIYNRSTKLENLLAFDAAAKILDGYIPQLRMMAEKNPQALKLSLEQLVKYTRLPEGEALLSSLDEALDKLNTPENAISPEEKALIERFQAIWQEDQKKTSGTVSHRQESITPGRPWLDTKGERIQAHGGAVFFEDDTYWWYGENKEHTDGKNGIWTWGIKVYASKDLMNWEDKGFLVPPVLDDPASALFPTMRIDRPHILKCPKTGKYVLYLKLSGPEAAFAVLEGDTLLGPYRMVKNLYNPGNAKIGDFDMIQDKETGKAYLYFDKDHEAMVTWVLSDDYLEGEKEVARSYAGLLPPFTREAPALFAWDGRKYMVTSGMTGYVPNRSDSASAAAWDETFVSLGDPHVEDASRASFNSQISKIFPVEGKEGLFVAMADRWLPETKVDSRLADLFTRVIAGNYDKSYTSTTEEKKEMYEANKLEEANTSIADYVWLPVRIRDGRPVIEWKDSWSPEDEA